jgi:hypothetical protein
MTRRRQHCSVRDSGSGFGAPAHSIGGDVNEKLYRKFMKNAAKAAMRHRRGPIIGMQGSLQDSSHELGIEEGIIKYGFLGDVTDEEASEITESMSFGTGVSYDCSGRLFTFLIYWHRNPDGNVSYIHHMRLDI